MKNSLWRDAPGTVLPRGLRCRNTLPRIFGGGTRLSQFENNYFTEMCSGSEAGSYLRPIDFVYHSTLGLRVIKKKKDHCAT